jgi:hypothetical protein
MNPFFPSTITAMPSNHSELKCAHDKRYIVNAVVEKINSWDKDTDKPDFSYTIRLTGLAQEIIVGKDKAMLWIKIDPKKAGSPIVTHTSSNVDTNHPQQEPEETKKYINKDGAVQNVVEDLIEELEEILHIEDTNENAHT